MEHMVIAVGRRYGSGGHEIGERLAKWLGIPFYDRELVEMASKKSGIAQGVLEIHNERAVQATLLKTKSGAGGQLIGELLFQLQSQIIRELAEESSCVVMIQDGKAAVLSFGGYRTGAVAELLQRYRVTQVEALCLPDRGPEAREAAVQVLEEYGAKQLVLPEDAYVGRDLELALGDALPVFLEGGDSVSLWAGGSAQVLPQWEGLLLSVHGVELLVEWGPGQSRDCGLLFTNQPQTRVNAPLSVWQTDGIIGENGQGLAFSPEGEGAVLPVEEGCVEVSVSPEGTVSVRREG